MVDVDGHALRYVASGTISTRHLARGELPARLKVLFDGIGELAERYRPDAAAVEIVFVNVNPQSTLLLGQARGACITALVTSRLTVAEYTALQNEAGGGRPRQGGQGAGAGNGPAPAAVAGPAGAATRADALGLAITHAQVGRTMARLGTAATLARSTSGMYKQGRTR